MTRYSRRHYEDTVRVIGEVHAIQLTVGHSFVSRNAQSMLTLLTIEKWGKVFMLDNPAFDPDKFVAAAVEACEIDLLNLPLTFIPPLIRRILPEVTEVTCEICGNSAPSRNAIRHSEEDCFK